MGTGPGIPGNWGQKGFELRATGAVSGSRLVGVLGLFWEYCVQFWAQRALGLGRSGFWACWVQDVLGLLILGPRILRLFFLGSGFDPWCFQFGPLALVLPSFKVQGSIPFWSSVHNQTAMEGTCSVQVSKEND